MACNAPSNAKVVQKIKLLVAAVLHSTLAGNQEAPPAAKALFAAAVVFATSPGVAAVKELVNYTTKHGASLYEETVAPFGMIINQV